MDADEVANLSEFRVTGDDACGLLNRASEQETVSLSGAWEDRSSLALEDIRTHLASRHHPPPVLTVEAHEYRLSLRWDGTPGSQPVHHVGKGDRGNYSEELTNYRRDDISLLRSPGQYELAVAYEFDEETMASGPRQRDIFVVPAAAMARDCLRPR